MPIDDSDKRPGVSPYSFGVILGHIFHILNLLLTTDMSMKSDNYGLGGRESSNEVATRAEV